MSNNSLNFLSSCSSSNAIIGEISFWNHSPTLVYLGDFDEEGEGKAGKFANLVKEA